ncbi:hypothetical protein SCB49_14530 [unidentified eubacterium SCB49]|nr:hypothetical protein SCB49_14530 [unidentified eubacterium SCB49]
MRLSRLFFKRLIALFIVIVLAVALLATFVLPYAIIKPQRLHIDIDPAEVSVHYSPVSIPFNGSSVLRGYLFKPKEELPKATLILVHGIGGSKAHFFSLAANLTKDGYATIVMDNRAHGDSDGEFVTYGYKEKDDISLIVQFLKEEYPNTKIGIWGKSMGGAIAMQAMAKDQNIDFGIIESTFTNLEQIVYDYQKRFSGGIGVRFLTDYVLDRAGQIADFDPEKVSPENAAKLVKKPVFIAHGDQDKRISYNYGVQLFENLASKDKTFELVKGAGHINVDRVGGQAYYNKVLSFISRQIE